MVRLVLFVGAAFVLVMAAITWLVDAPYGRREQRPPVVPAEFEKRLEALELQNAELRAELAALEQGVLDGSSLAGPLLHRYPVPDEVNFCGERLPLDRDDVYARFEEEWTRFLVNQHWTIKWLRRSRDIFPYVEARLAAEGMPTDLKYVLIVESGLESRAYSSAGAAGWWQFIHSTGSRYGLKRDNVVDQRRDLALATDAAIRYFDRLYGEFGSWALALSAYNAGERRVRDEIAAQGEKDFYALSLPRETEAYWFKAAAAKVLMEQPERYGIVLSPDSWAPAVCDTLELNVTRKRLELRDIASAAGISYRELRELNPSYRHSWIPRGMHRFVLPQEGVDAVLASVEGIKLASRKEGGVRDAAPGEAGRPESTGPATASGLAP